MLYYVFKGVLGAALEVVVSNVTEVEGLLRLLRDLALTSVSSFLLKVVVFSRTPSQ